MTSHNKGLELELSVHAIEAAIVETSPSLRGSSCTIQRRKLLKIHRVRHEIDVHVTFDGPHGYTSTFIFECKNWKRRVGKNLIMNFSKLIDAVGAQRGFFIAKAYSKDAVAQAQLDQRIALLHATQHDTNSSGLEELFHSAVRVPSHAQVIFRAPGSQGRKITDIDLQSAVLTLSGIETPLKPYLDAWMNQLYDQQITVLRTERLPNGIHAITTTGDRSYSDGECALNGQSMASATLEATFRIQIDRPAVVSDFEVMTRGRAIHLDKVKTPDLEFQISFVALHKEEEID